MVLIKCAYCAKEFEKKGRRITCSPRCSKKYLKKKVKTNHHIYYLKNKEKIMNQNKEWREKNPDKLKAYMELTRESKRLYARKHYKKIKINKVKEYNRKSYEKRKASGNVGYTKSKDEEMVPIPFIVKEEDNGIKELTTEKQS